MTAKRRTLGAHPADRFPPRTRRLITDYIVAFASGDYRKLSRVLLAMDAVAQGVDLDAVQLRG